MKTIVIYKSKYGSTKAYAEEIARRTGADLKEARTVKINDIMSYDNIVYGGGLYAEVISGVSLICKNLDKLADKKIAVFTTGITPIDCADYYDRMVVEKNFKNGIPENVKYFYYPGKMVLKELTPVHRTALIALKKLMSARKNPTEMEKLLVSLCDADGDFSDVNLVGELVDYIG